MSEDNNQQQASGDIPEELEHEHQERLARGRAARELLQNPLLEGFFQAHFRACYDAFVALPLGATLDQYRAVHFKLISIQELRSALEAYVAAGRNEALRQTFIDETEAVASDV